MISNPVPDRPNQKNCTPRCSNGPKKPNRITAYRTIWRWAITIPLSRLVPLRAKCPMGHLAGMNRNYTNPRICIILLSFWPSGTKILLFSDRCVISVRFVFRYRFNYPISPISSSPSSHGMNRTSPYIGIMGKINSKDDDVHGSAVSLVSTTSSLYSTPEEKQAHEVRKLRKELQDAQEKVHTLTNQLSTNVSTYLKSCLPIATCVINKHRCCQLRTIISSSRN
ncbi:unnamed protein product [Nesidiocoris tenuis]|uniref:Uncharacterized protein n=1 Tax=Nesidiocoris tenuis TaxID=355587 RepID=A0A6H5GST2_9HEMI|nr:unnamed protein product [Nesidiocoris tenuis]